MKKTFLLKTMLLLCALVAGSTNVWASETYEKVTSAPSDWSGIYLIVYEGNATHDAYAFDGSLDNLDQAMKGVAVTISEGVITGSDKIDAATFTIAKSEDNYTIKSASGYYIGQTSYANGLRSSKTDAYLNSINLDEDGNAVIKSNLSGDVVTLRYNYASDQLRFRYYKSGQQAIALYKKTESATPTCALPSFSPADGTFTSAQNVEISTTTEDATIYYTTDGSTPTTSSNVYSSAIAVSTTTTIKAIAVKEGYDNSSIATATYTIVSIEHAGTQADPYTVADARTAIDANIGLTGVYATGIVSEIVTAYNSQFGNISYNISADGETTSVQLQAYRGKSYNGENFTSADDIQVGDIVVVYGDLKKYNDTYEFDTNNQLVTLERPVITTPTISIDATSLNGFTYAEGNGPSDVQSFTLSGLNLTEDITLSVEGNYEASLSADENFDSDIAFQQAAGIVSEMTVYVRLKAGLTESNYNGTITLTSTGATDKIISLTGSVTEPEALNFTWDLSKKTYVETTAEDIVTWLSSYATMSNSSKSGGTKATNYLGGDANNRTSSRFYKDNTLTITPIAGYAITSVVFTATSDNYATSLKNSTWTNATAAVEASTVTVIPTDGTAKISATIGGTCGFTKVKVYYEAANTVYVAIDDNIGYVTFGAPVAVDFSATDVEVYTAAVSGNKVMLTAVDSKKVPANTAVILKGETVTGTVIASADALEDNELLVSDGTVVGNGSIYVLAKKDAVGFYKLANDVTIPAGKCYLDTASSAPEFLGFSFGEEATGISQIENGELRIENVYNLNGQRVAQPSKGLYIMNGRKVVIK